MVINKNIFSGLVNVNINELEKDNYDLLLEIGAKDADYGSWEEAMLNDEDDEVMDSLENITEIAFLATDSLLGKALVNYFGSKELLMNEMIDPVKGAYNGKNGIFFVTEFKYSQINASKNSVNNVNENDVLKELGFTD